MSADPPLVRCCGWREARARYFENFPVVELQDTFYEPPSLALAAKWRMLAPPAFRFCLKAWQVITHTAASPTYRRLKSKFSDSEKAELGAFQSSEQVWLAWERTDAIARVLQASVVLLQCPKSFTPERKNIANLRRFLSRVRQPEAPAYRLAWEPRGSWPPELIRELCAEFDLVDCVDPFDRSSVYGGVTYWRLHGRGGYSYRYSDQELAHLRDQLPGQPAYVMFNNVWMKEDALRFQRLLSADG